MASFSNENKFRPRVLISGFLPPPFSGMGTYYQTLLESNLKFDVDYQFVSTSTQNRDMSSSGKASFANLTAAISDCVRFTKKILTFHPQITHIGTAFGLSFVKHSFCIIIALIFRSKVLLHPHCSINALYFGKSKLWKWYFRLIVSKTKGIIALSQEWMQLISICPKSKVFYLPNPINITKYNSILEYHLSHQQNKDDIKVLYLGHLGKEKGSFDIIETANLIRSQNLKISFDLVGSDLKPGELSQLKEKVYSFMLEEFVNFFPPVYGNEKLLFFKNADIFIYPSYHEGMPMAILEAMACGLPIIASKVGGIPDMVKNDINGILIEPGNPEQLSIALINLAKNHELRKSMQKWSYQLVYEKFNIENHIVNLSKIYRKLLIIST